jgi:hypothetical protein
VMCFFVIQSREVFAWSRLQTKVHLTSTSWLAGIIGLSHWHLAIIWLPISLFVSLLFLSLVLLFSVRILILYWIRVDRVPGAVTHVCMP